MIFSIVTEKALPVKSFSSYAPSFFDNVLLYTCVEQFGELFYASIFILKKGVSDGGVIKFSRRSRAKSRPYKLYRSREAYNNTVNKLHTSETAM